VPDCPHTDQGNHLRSVHLAALAISIAAVTAVVALPEPGYAGTDAFTWTDASGDTRDGINGQQAAHPPADILGAQANLPTDGEAHLAMRIADWFPSQFAATWAFTPDPNTEESVYEFKVNVDSSGFSYATVTEIRYGTRRSMSCQDSHGVVDDDDGGTVIIVFDTACLPDVPLYVRASTYEYNGNVYEDWAPDANFESTGYGYSEFSSYNWTGPVTKHEPATAQRPQPAARDYTEVCADAPPADFSDIDGNVHESAIRCVAGYGIAQGTGNGRYSPSDTLTKGQTATFLMRLLDAAGYEVPPGDDYCRGTAGVHEANVEALIGVGVIPPGDCSASVVITRAEMAAWSLAVIDGAGVPPAEMSDGDFYPDDEGHRYETSINGLTAHGVITGKTDGTFGPDETLSRAQMATFLARILDVIAY
jgi:hypothetical protein